MMKKQPFIEKSRGWVEQFVIGLQLCPFAKRPFDRGQVRFEVCLEKSTEAQLVAFWKEVERLTTASGNDISNIILIYPNGLDDFEKYLNLFDLAEQLLADQQKNGEFQLASFHPDYQFAGTEKEDVSNYTNRSPFPFIHILRVAEVEAAIASYTDIKKVPERNIKLLDEMGIAKIKALLNTV